MLCYIRLPCMFYHNMLLLIAVRSRVSRSCRPAIYIYIYIYTHMFLYIYRERETNKKTNTNDHASINNNDNNNNSNRNSSNNNNKPRKARLALVRAVAEGQHVSSPRHVSGSLCFSSSIV